MRTDLLGIKNIDIDVGKKITRSERLKMQSLEDEFEKVNPDQKKLFFTLFLEEKKVVFLPYH